MRRLFTLLFCVLPTIAVASPSVEVRVRIWPYFTTVRPYPMTEQVWVRRTIDQPPRQASIGNDSSRDEDRPGQHWRRYDRPAVPAWSDLTPYEEGLDNQGRSTDHAFQSGTPNYRVLRTVRVIATAYNSRRNQTDGTPWRTATSRLVRDGDIACNFLPFGTLVRIIDGPAIVQGKIFRVEDRLAEPPPLGRNQIDIWMLRVSDALAFGQQRLTLQVLGDPAGEAPH